MGAGHYALWQWLVAWWTGIDWVASGTWMQAWAGFAGVAAVVYAAHKGTATFKSWLRQQQTERRIAAAEGVLNVTYRLKRAFRAIRSPGYLPYERVAAEQKLAESLPEYENISDVDHQGRLIWAQVILSRLHSYQDDWDALFACVPLAKAHFGEEVEAALTSFWEQQAAVNVAAHAYGRATASDNGSLEGTLWDGAGSNKVGEAISHAITTLEAKLLPVLRSEVQV